MEEIKAGKKPVDGGASRPGSIREIDETGRVTNVITSGAPLDTAHVVSPQEYEKQNRVGDYYYSRNGSKVEVVPNSPTDIFNKWKTTTDTTLYSKPTLASMNLEGVASPVLGVTPVAGLVLPAAIKAGSTAGIPGLATMFALTAVISANAQMAQEKAVRNAIKEWEKSQENAVWKVAGNLKTEDDGTILFTPDPSKAIGTNTAFAGSEIQKAFNKETDVYFGDDGRLKISINPIYAATDDYKEKLGIIKKGFAGLTKDSENAAEAVEEIKSLLTTYNNQFKFREQSLYSYKREIPDASNEAIEDAYANELGAYMSEKDGADFDVKVYRNGKVVEETAQKVLDDFYNKNLGERSDYMLDLFSKLEDPTLDADDKVYVLSEIKMLQAADSNDQKYDNGEKDADGNAVKTVNKYYGMLDQESIVSVQNNWSIFGGFTVMDMLKAIDAITPWNMNISDQRGLQEDPAAASAARLISTATSAIASYYVMQGIEHKIVRPVTGKVGVAVSSAFDRMMENAGANGGMLGELVGDIQLSLNAFAEGHRGAFSAWFQGARLAATPLVSTLGYSLKELLYNATSDLIFDATKFGLESLAGEEPTGEEFLTEFGTDLLLDLMIQYGPAGIAGMRMEFDNARIDQVYAPFKEGVDTARHNFDVAEVEFETIKEEVQGMRKGTKKYKEAEKQMKSKERAYQKAQKIYDERRTEAEAAIMKELPTLSERAGSYLAGKISQAEKTKMIEWIRKRFFDEKTGLSTLAEQAYSKTSDVNLFVKALNKLGNIQGGTQTVIGKLRFDMYAKGTGKAWEEWGRAVEAAAPRGKFSKAQDRYIKAKVEYEVFTKEATDAKNEAKLKEVEETYRPVLNTFSGEDAKQLDNVVVTMKAFIAKIGESYVNSGAASQKEIDDIRKAALGIGYVPMWKKPDNKSQKFVMPERLSVGHKYDQTGKLYNLDDFQSPIVSTALYVNHIANNIARNEAAAMLKDLTSIEGLGAELVGGGAAGAKPEFQDIIDKAVESTANKKKLLLSVISPDKYIDGLQKAVSTNGGDAVAKSIDETIAKQNQLKRLVALNNAETDIAKKARRVTRIKNLETQIKAQKTQIRAEIDNQVRAAGEYFNKTYKKYGISVDVEDFLTSAKYTDVINGKLDTMSTENLMTLKDDVSQFINKVAPYLEIKKIDKEIVKKQSAAVAAHVQNRVNKEHSDWTEKQKKAAVKQAVANFNAQLSGDFRMYNSAESFPTAGAYKIEYTINGEDASFYIKGDLAKEIALEMQSDTVVERRGLWAIFKTAANVKRLLTTGIDPTRVLPNLWRDTGRNLVFSGFNETFMMNDNTPFGFPAQFRRLCESVGETPEQIEEMFNTLKAGESIVSESTFNAAMSGGRPQTVKRIVTSAKETGKNRGVRILWELGHNKRDLLEAPMDWAEGLTRRRAFRDTFMREYLRGGGSLSHETRLQRAFEAGLNSGRENTVNFMRRGKWVKEISAFVPYFSQKFSSLESAKISFLKDPIGVSVKLLMFATAYMVELSRTLSDERSRKNYYNLSEYDRENNIILTLGGGDLVTIPLDETLAALITPWRRGIETWHKVDPESFFGIMVDSFVALSPIDLSGFSEGDSFNFGRGVEKMGAEMLPTFMQAMYTQATGRNMYYGSQVNVTADSLAEYGNYNRTAGDYTTPGENSRHLRALADAFGIEQWRIQQAISVFGGNVGQYVVNWLDKISGAPESEQGGKEFVNATFKSFTGMDSEQVKYAFNDGIAKLEAEKEKIKGKLKNINNQISLASGERLAELQGSYDKVMQDFAMKVGNFVDKYINAYEIAGGLTRSQANKLWYLFNFSDDDTMAMVGSPEAYYRENANKEAKSEATKYSASILDKYYDQNKNIYKDDDGVWRYYAPYGENAFFNTISGRGMQYQVGLRNLIEGKKTNLSNAHSAAYTARQKAADAGDWDEYDRIGLEFDDKVIDAIAPYIERYGADEVLSSGKVLDYLEEWFFVPTDYMKSKYGKNVSLAHNASKQRAFARPYIKELFGVSTAYNGDNYVSRPDRLVRGEE